MSVATNAGGSTWLWARTDLRHRWKSLVVLGLLAGITAGLALASYDGANRTATALTRLRAATNASDAAVFASEASDTTPHHDWTTLAKRPEVKSVAVWSLVFGALDGQPNGLLFAPSGTTFSDVDRPVLVAGRMYDPNSPNEMVVDENTIRQGQAKLGQVFQFQAAGSVDDFNTGTFTGPTTDITIVGVVRTVAQFVFVPDGMALLSPGYLKTYGSKVFDLQNAFVQLNHVPDAIGQLSRDVNTDVVQGAGVLDENAEARRVRTTTNVEHTILIALALVILLAGSVLVGQALTRSAATVGSDANALRAMGQTRGQLVLAALEPHLLTAAVAMASAATTAVIASRWFPVGIAARIDPNRGFRISIVLVVAGTLVLGLLVLGAVALAARSATSSTPRNPARAGSGVAHWLRGVRPLTLRLGATMAYDVGARRSSSATRPALVGSVAAIIGIVGALTLDHGLVHALDNPRLAGVTWDATAIPNGNDTSGPVSAAFTDTIRNQPDVQALALVDRELFPINGGAAVATYT
ncbi:MAG TPA: hypothetical protein VGM78_06680, partial [Ilumatobacteraceae bacterium]